MTEPAASGVLSQKNRIALWLFPVIIILFSTSLTALSADLVLRVIGKKLIYYRPNEIFLEKWPKLPLVSRYKKNVVYEGESFGDLAAMLGDTRFREIRRVRFETDAFGFSNNHLSPGNVAYDVIVMGDSFGVGLGTTQNRTWVAQLKDRYGIKTYNLSIPGGSPWQSYVNFASEARRLSSHPGSVALITVFSGNDLDDYYHDVNVAVSDLPWNNAWQSFEVHMSACVKRSPLLRLLGRINHGNSSAAEVLIRELPDGRPMLFYLPYLISKNRTMDMVRTHVNYPRLLDTLRAIRNLASDYGLISVVVLFPSKGEIYDWVVNESQSWKKSEAPGGLGAALKDSLGKENITFIDFTPELATAAEKAWKNSRELIYWTDDTHWNEKGHGIVADIVYRTVLNASPCSS